MTSDKSRGILELQLTHLQTEDNILSLPTVCEDRGKNGDKSPPTAPRPPDSTQISIQMMAPRIRHEM